ncbi:MAG: transposase [Vicinamibacterales bacterium]
MGKRSGRQRQEEFWIASSQVVQTPGHVFYNRLNEVLASRGFDARVERLCRHYYTGPRGQPSLPPGTYFRCLLIGFFEGLDSERGIAWRVADSLSIRRFLGYGIDELTPDHSTISRTRRLFKVSTHRAVFRWVLRVLQEEGLLKGKTILIDGTTLEANAALRSIRRRDTGESYDDYLTRLAEAAGIAHPTRADLARFDRKRQKKGSNAEWEHPDDPEARITKMKDGRTHLAHKVEHAVDAAAGALLAITLHPADAGDTTTGLETVAAAQATATAVGLPAMAEGVLDKGYHSDAVMVALQQQGIRSYVAEPKRGRRRWRGKAEAQRAVYANRRRLRGVRNQRLQAQRAELCERSNAHLYETGGMRRLHLRGRQNILKRLLIQAAAFNLALFMRKTYGVGTPRGLQDRLESFMALVKRQSVTLSALARSIRAMIDVPLRLPPSPQSPASHANDPMRSTLSTTGC